MTLRLDAVQRRLASVVTKEIEAILETPINISALSIKRIDEVTLHEAVLLDKQGDTIIVADNITAHISPFKLLKNRIQINTLNIAAPQIKIYRNKKQAPLNIQFIIDKLRSDNKSDANFKLRINQLLIYDGTFTYDIYDEPSQVGKFDPSHIAIEKIRCNISLKELHKNNFDLHIRTIEGVEKSGLELKKIKTRIDASNGRIRIRNLEAQLQNSHLSSDSITLYHDKHNANALQFSGNIESEYFTIADLAPIHEKLTQELPTIAFSFNGYSDSIQSRATLWANTLNNDIELKTVATINSPYSNERSANIYLRQLNLSSKGIELLESFIPSNELDLAKRIGECSMSGEAGFETKEANCDITVETINGNISAAACFNQNGTFNISVTGDGINISDIAKIKEPLNCSLQAKADGYISKDKIETKFCSEIIEFQTSKYTFAPIRIVGTFDSDNCDFSTDIKIDDPGILANLSLNYTKNDEERVVMSLDVDSINPCRIGFNEKEDEKYSFNLDGELNIHDKNISMFNAKLQNFTFYDKNGASKIKNLHFCDSRTEDQRLMMLNSDFIKCSIIGDFEYSTILNSFYNLASKHVPSLEIENKKTEFKNNYILNCELLDTRFISRMLDLPAVIEKPSFIHGTCYDENGILDISCKLNEVKFKKSRYSAVELMGNSNDDRLAIATRVVIPAKKRQKESDNNDMEIIMNSILANDTIRNYFHWSNNKEKKRTEGTLRASTILGRDTCNLLSINATLLPDSIIHKDSVWYVSGGDIIGNVEKLNINSIHLYNDSQYLHLNGEIGKGNEDILQIKANNLEVSTILDLVRFRILQFNGNATGQAEISSLMSSPNVSGKFNVDSFKIDNGYLGRTDLNIGWENSSKSILLDADILNDNGKHSIVNGFLSQANDTIHLDIAADELNASFINKLTGSFLTDIEGNASGNVSLLGKWRQIDLRGGLKLNCGARLLHTNVKYNFHGDSLHFSSGRLSFNDALVTDKHGNKGWLSGEVTHSHLGNWACNLNARAENLLVYDTNNFDVLPLYGTVYATGDVNLKTNEKGIFLKAQVSNNPNSRIVYNSSDLGGVKDNSFVTFIDSSKKQTNNTEKKTEKYKNVDSKLNLDFLLDINESMQVKVYTNLKSDDYIELYGKGAINAIYDEKEGFSMKGNLDLDRGTYKITVQDIFTKEFSISKGSSLLFNGDPYEATLDLKAKYLVPSASLNALTTESTKRKTVKVNCLLNITGTLESPVLSFDLELPEGSEEEKEMLASATSTPEQKNMQFIYLLGIGKFYTYDYNNPLATNTQSSTAMESLISNTLSGQLNNMLGQIIDNGNWNISGNISTSERGWNSMEVEGMLEGRLLNDRLLINGNFGYRENPIANRNFIGDFELQWLLNKTGTVSLRAYSKTNDRYFSKTNLTTQGAGIILRHDFNRWIWWKKDKKKKKDKKESK